jgi:hypothetical protein
MIEDIHSDENNALDPALSREPFRLGLPLRPSSPPEPTSHSVNRSAVSSPSTSWVTAIDDRDDTSFGLASPVPASPPPNDADDSDGQDDGDDESEDPPLPTPQRLRLVHKQPQQPAPALERYVFQLVERHGRWYYDVRGDAVSSSGHAQDPRLIVQRSS